MTPTNNLQLVPEFARDAGSEYVDAAGYKNNPNVARGFRPLETLPAKWYNSLMQILTQQAQATKTLCDSMYAELRHVITSAGLTLDAASSTQLKEAIDKLERLVVATTQQLGSVKSSVADWKVSVDNTTGVMTVNTTKAGSSDGLCSTKTGDWGVTFTDGKGVVNTVDASTLQKGLVKLYDNVDDSSTDLALTARQGMLLNNQISHYYRYDAVAKSHWIFTFTDIKNTSSPGELLQGSYVILKINRATAPREPIELAVCFASGSGTSMIVDTIGKQLRSLDEGDIKCGCSSNLLHIWCTDEALALSVYCLASGVSIALAGNNVAPTESNLIDVRSLTYTQVNANVVHLG